jgi:mercuric ion transport protein
MRAENAAALGSVMSALLASACCIGPLVFAVLGISGAAAAQRFEPLRPYLLVLTYGLLGGAFYSAYGRRPACAPTDACAMPRASRFARAMLWVAAVVAVLATAFPWYAEYLPL